MTDEPTPTVLVNGVRSEVHTEPDTALLYVLRNHLGLKGTRFGCGLGLCGACLVLVDGHPEYSCDTPLWALGDRAVTTVEGLSAPGHLHPVAQAIVDEQAAQCGYCISGIVVAAAVAAARERRPHRRRSARRAGPQSVPVRRTQQDRARRARRGCGDPCD